MLNFLNLRIWGKLFPLFVFIFLSFYTLHLKHLVSKLEKENYYLKNKLEELIKENSALTKQISLQKQKYEKKIAKLLKLASKPPKVIKVPKVITKKIYITPKECRQMAQMIDEFIEIERKDP